MPGFRPRVDIATSALSQRLRSPGSHQRSEIIKILKDIDKDLDDYASEISALEMRAVFLKTQRERVQNQKHALRSLLSPINQLPNELLLRVFIFACDQNDIDCNHNVIALNIAAVCGKWRGLAIASSELWSHFTISLPDHEEFDEATNSHTENRLDIYLQRSQRQLLTIYIRANMRWNEAPDHPLLPKLVEHSPRWQHLTFEAFQAEPRLFPSLYSVSLSSLETLELVSSSGDPEDLDPVWIPPFPNKLRSISAASSLAEGSTPFLGALHGVTSFTFSPSTHDLLEPLKWLPNIRHLGFRLDDLKYTGPSASYCSAPITSMEVQLGPEWNCGTAQLKLNIFKIIMDSLTAPSLSMLVLKNLICDPALFSPSISHIDTFIKRSACNLKTLELRGLSMSDSCVINLLQRLHSLVELTIEDPYPIPGISAPRTFPISKSLISSLHTYHPNFLHPIVPNLRALVLIVWSKDFDHQSFVSTISSRWIPDQSYAEQIGVACLRSVELHLLGEVDTANYSALDLLEKAGMQIVVKGAARGDWHS